MKCQMGNNLSWAVGQKVLGMRKPTRTFCKYFKHLVNLHVTKYYVIDSIIFGTCGCMINRCREIYFEEEKKWWIGIEFVG